MQHHKPNTAPDGPRTRLTLDAFRPNPVESLLDTMIGLLKEILEALRARQSRDEETKS